MKYIILPLILLTACYSGPKHIPASEFATTPAVDTFQAGKVTPSINLRSNTGESFALYLPNGYSENTRFPAIIFFDPHGDGTVPLNLYKELADKFHYVLIGSNSSKNGMKYDESSEIANNLIREARMRLSVDENKIALCGFSGGAKVALTTGALNPKITDIIYCGATQSISPDHNIRLLGFAGTKDMNYTDLIMFDHQLTDSLTKHYIIQWNGKHEFPTPTVFNDAFAFLTTGNIENYEKKQPTLTSKEMLQEQSLKQQYINAFQTKDLSWWKNEIASLNEKKKSDLMYERLLGFISLGCYSISNNALKQNNLPLAEKILAIYAIADPGNEDCKKFTEELKSKQGK